MKTVQMTIEKELLEAVDVAAKQLGSSRSAFTREALREMLKKVRESQLETRHRRGYSKHPVKANEFDVWEREQQ
jgi:metal-responsive CopG/Arc/MetJ family transcriptional regulator